MFYIKNKVNNKYLYTKNAEYPTSLSVPVYGYDTEVEATAAITNLLNWNYYQVYLVYPDNSEVLFSRGKKVENKSLETSDISSGTNASLKYNDIKLF